MLLFSQALQPVELSWLRWCDVDFAEKDLRVVSKRQKAHNSKQLTVNLQPLSAAEIEILEQLQEESTTDWLFASERQQRLSDRSLRHLSQQAGEIAELAVSVHPYMLRRSRLYLRSALLLQPLGLSLHQCCLLWNWYATTASLSPQQWQEVSAISPKTADAFHETLKQLQAFTGIQQYEHLIDYLLGAFSLFPQLEDMPKNYWLNPNGWGKQCR